MLIHVTLTFDFAKVVHFVIIIHMMEGDLAEIFGFC